MLQDHVRPEDWETTSVDFGDDESVLLRIKYVGSSASGIVDIDSAGDITFKHGVLSSEVVDTDTKINSGGSGILDLSADVDDYHSLIRHINTFDNWRAWAVGSLPDDDPHTTTTGHFTEVTGGNASATGGYAVKTDDTDSKYIVAGITFRVEPDGRVHNTDHGVLHELYRVISKSTYASGTSLIKAYACNDDDGTKVQIWTAPTGATTVETAYPAETSPVGIIPLATTKGKRIAVQLLNSAALSVVRLKIEGRSYAFAPGVEATKDYVYQLD